MTDTNAATKDGRPVTSNETVIGEAVRVTFADVNAAPKRIRDGVPKTPCEVSRLFIRLTRGDS